MGALAAAAGAAAVKLGKEVIGQFGELEQNLKRPEAYLRVRRKNTKSRRGSYKNLGVSQRNIWLLQIRWELYFRAQGVEQQKSLS